jgi:transcriptional regulator with XRE-family HTH domain
MARPHAVARRVGFLVPHFTLALAMGVDRAYVSGLELGQRNPTVVTLWHAAQALEVEVHLLLRQAG